MERSPYELPLVTVEREAKTKKSPSSRKRKGFFNWLVGLFKKEEIATEAPVPKPEYINIELIGGGYYGGIDPVVKDFVHIKSNGRLIHEFKSHERGEVINKGDISRQELEEFADFISTTGFFDYERIYDCEESACQRRKRKWIPNQYP